MLHNCICDSHQEDHDFIQQQSDDDGEGGKADSDSDEKEEEGDNDDGGGGRGHIVYEPTGNRAMEVLRDNITNEYIQLTTWFFFAYNFNYHLYVIFI